MSYPRKFRKLPVEIEAMLYEGTTFSQNQIIFWIESSGQDETPVRHAGITSQEWHVDVDTGDFFIVTLEGRMLVGHGDYVIKGVKGEFYPCKNDIFNETYEEVTA